MNLSNDVTETPEAAATAPTSDSGGLLDLLAWAALIYQDGSRPCANTVRRWVRAGLVHPPPQKQGRSYYFHPSARYKRPPSPVKDEQ